MHPLNSPERNLTNSEYAGEDLGKVGGLGVVLELAGAFVDSLTNHDEAQLDVAQ